MANFNWESFLKKYNIPYITHGKNVGAGEINIKCPFCGNADPSQHMGLNKKSSKWACWRNSAHRGKSPVRLIARLLGCSTSRAREVAGIRNTDLTQLGSAIAALKGVSQTPGSTKPLTMPDSFKEITDQGVRKRFLDYLMGRGWSKYKALGIAKKYGLRCCLVGRWSHRIIVPIYYEGKLVSWLGRTVNNDMRRYLALSPKATPPDQPATRNIKDTVFNYDDLMATGGHTLYVVEGSMDAMNIDWHGHKRDKRVRATALFSADVSTQQTYLLQTLSKQFDRVVVLLDNGELANSLRVQARLTQSGVDCKLLTQVKDPGELTRKQLVKLLF